MKKVVRDGDSQFIVDPHKNECECGEQKCLHLRLARDYFIHHGRFSKFLFIAALHKELRRGDAARALHYGKLLETIFKPGFTASYVARIRFEETRNLDLLSDINGNYQNDVLVLAESRKKWQLGRISHTARKAQSFLRAKGMPQLKSYSEIWNRDSYYDALTDVFRIRIYSPSKKVRGTSFRHLFDLGPTDNPVVSSLGGKRNPTYYEVIAALESHYRLIDDLCSAKNGRTFKEIDADLLMPADYCYDNHVSSGKRMMRKSWHLVKPNMPMPGILNLTFSGLVISTLWREYAFDQLGEDYLKARWEDVLIPEKEFELALALDSQHHYPYLSTWDR